ncbi:hypothetical protein [Bacillus sp. S/N-304-OC-R1]|uniref:CBM96 family carbohydrate-binding protein n=1 Tax=Bacillus sp. S/N-304-OC-R1 TaxID=2758034 RepID=UPI001C8E3815|nr:hypothetical protein [Bacillus sp. S/N-304-OC-R1]MBY0122314.1 hypothetical protein [Bacillus sp. S/N-304-OC-R1]
MAKGFKRTIQLYLCFCLVMVSGGYLGIFEKTAKAVQDTQSNNVNVWAAKSTTFFDGEYYPEPSVDEFMDSAESPAFQFNLDDVNGEITSATLELFVMSTQISHGDSLWGTLYEISNDNWVNGYSTYNPLTYSEISRHDYKSSVVGELEKFDVTDFVKKELTSDSTKIISFLLQGDRNANPSNRVQIASATNPTPSQRPVLILTT